MAEAIGLAANIAGLASLAIQLTQGIATLRRFYRSVRNASETLEELISELEVISIAMNEVEREALRWDGTVTPHLLKQCLQFCERGAKRLNAVVKKIEKFEDRHHVLGRMYIAIKEKEERDLLWDLERAKNSLAFAFQLYTEARRQADVERQMLTMLQLARQMLALPDEVTVQLQGSPRDAHVQMSCVINGRCDDERRDDFGEYHATDRPAHRIDQQARSFSFKIPLRFRQQIWHLAAVRSISGWMLGLHTYTIRPWKAPVFELLKAGDLLGMRKLFASGQGSPFDCNEFGDTLLELAGRSNAVEMVRYLLDNFRYPDIDEIAKRVFAISRRDRFGNLLDAFGRPLGITSLACTGEFFRARLEYGRADPLHFYDCDADYGCENGLCYFSTPDCVGFLLQSLPVDLYSLPLDSRFGCAVHMDHNQATPQSFLRIVGADGVTPELAKATTFNGITALHMCVDALNSRWKAGRDLEEWPQFAKSLIEHGADLHETRARDYATPLLRLVTWNTGVLSFEMMLWRIRWWVSLLHSAGVDLMEYGSTEMALLEQIWDNQYDETDDCDSTYEDLVVDWNYCIYSVEYGPTLADWSLNLRPFEHLSFFQSSLMPGSWETDRTVPDIIAWPPSVREWSAGKWKPMNRGYASGIPRGYDGNQKVLFGSARDLRDLIEDEGPSAFDRIVACTQDDHGAVVLLLRRARGYRAQGSSKRNASEPPLLARRKRAYCVPGRPDYRGTWLRNYHLCPADGRHRFGCGMQSPFAGVNWFTQRDGMCLSSCVGPFCAHGKQHGDNCRDCWWEGPFNGG